MKKLMLVLLAALAANAADAVKVQQVNDRRTRGSFSQLQIALELPSVTATSVAASRVLVASAKDDAGNDLVDHEAQEPALEENFRKEGNASVSLTLKNPPRSATKVVEAKGEIELFMPGKDPNSTAELTKFVPGNGKPMSHKALKSNGVEISFLTAAQLDADNAKREEWDRVKLDENELAIRVKDPEKRIQSMTYIDSKGEPQRVMMRDEKTLAVLSTWAGKPAADWKLRVNLRTTKNTVRMPFAVRDVPLP